MIPAVRAIGLISTKLQTGIVLLGEVVHLKTPGLSHLASQRAHESSIRQFSETACHDVRIQGTTCGQHGIRRREGGGGDSKVTCT